MGEPNAQSARESRFTPPKTVHLVKELQPVYRPEDRMTKPLFPELFPFGGKLDEGNRRLLMYVKKTHRIGDRIVSLHRPYPWFKAK